jgi:hypothetical protein
MVPFGLLVTDNTKSNNGSCGWIKAGQHCGTAAGYARVSTSGRSIGAGLQGTGYGVEVHKSNGGVTGDWGMG